MSECVHIGNAVNAQEFWALLDPLLAEEGQSAVDHIGRAVARWDGEIRDMPIFNPVGAVDSPLLTIHEQLRTMLETQKSPPADRPVATEEELREMFAYWFHQLREARKEPGII